VDSAAYFSDEFNVPKYTSGTIFPPMKDSFRNFVKEKYISRDEQALVGHSGGCTTNKANGLQSATDQKKKIIETGWTYTGPFPSGGGH
jgi:hypothetical protein